jgi:hypothetical protein
VGSSGSTSAATDPKPCMPPMSWAPSTVAPYARMGSITARLGEVGLPESVASLAARHWDAVIIGGGHNGLSCAAYLARAGQRVLVLEARERLGGACTLERPFLDHGYVVSPCAYVVGLLDRLVIDELELAQRGVEVYIADPNVWAPFPDGGSFAQWLDDAKTQASLDTTSTGTGHTNMSSTRCGSGCVRAGATPGSATRPGVTSSKRCWVTTNG